MPFRPRYTGLIDKYRDRLPVHDDTRVISLGEGNTPLIKLENIPDLLDKEVELYVKYEGLNPTGSFKDRGMTAAITQAVFEGAKTVICASTGNTAASAAAYAARAGLRCLVLVPEGESIVYKVKHFHPNLTGWEEKEESVDFPLVKVSHNIAYFQGLTIMRDGDQLIHYL